MRHALSIYALRQLRDNGGIPEAIRGYLIYLGKRTRRKASRQLAVQRVTSVDPRELRGAHARPLPNPLPDPEDRRGQASAPNLRARRASCVGRRCISVQKMTQQLRLAARMNGCVSRFSLAIEAARRGAIQCHWENGDVAGDY